MYKGGQNWWGFFSGEWKLWVVQWFERMGGVLRVVCCGQVSVIGCELNNKIPHQQTTKSTSQKPSKISNPHAKEPFIQNLPKFPNPSTSMILSAVWATP